MRVVKIEGPVTKKKYGSALKAIDNAISQINSVNSQAKIRLTESGKPDISVILVHDRAAAFEGTPRSVDDIFQMGGAYGMAEVFTARGDTRIQQARVTIVTDVDERFLKSMVLEEIVQSLGLLTDVHNRYYHNRSIFSETGSNVRKLKGQDANAIRMHYPP